MIPYAIGDAACVLRTIASNAGTTPSFTVGNATARTRCTSGNPATMNVFQPFISSFADEAGWMSTSECFSPMLSAAFCQASSGVICALPASASSPLTVDEADATFQLPAPPVTPTVTSPPSAAARPSNVCRNVTACPSLKESFESL